MSEINSLVGRELDLVEQVDLLRLRASRRLEDARKTKLGQFLTPAPIARFMASMLECQQPAVRILDAGAGVGSLFAACVSDLCHRKERPKEIVVLAIEIEETLGGYLAETMALCKAECDRVGIAFAGEVLHADFINTVVDTIQASLFSPVASRPSFTCAVLNPPYKKIHAQSPERKLLNRMGVQTSNLYSGFLAGAAHLLEPHGELVAITPRSFCNGPYFRQFRRFLLRNMTIDRLHVFESRQMAFNDDDVLQENVIFHAFKGNGKPDKVVITSSVGPNDEMISMRELAHEQVVHPDDSQFFIHLVPDGLSEWVADRMSKLACSLGDLDIGVSTGKVVDFRARQFLRPQPDAETVPLIHPTHFEHGYVAWPKTGTKKANAIVSSERTEALLAPSGNYVLVRRFSSKEEKRRVVAAVFEAERLPDTAVGFENHLNYFHQHGSGLDLALAKGLAAFLNSTLFDQYFRQFSGHTQVNATDLRNMRYPTLRVLEAIGSRIGRTFLEQSELDRLVEAEIIQMEAGSELFALTRRRIEEALTVLSDLGLPRGQQNERSALTLLALLDLRPDISWAEATDPLRGITPMMDFFAQHYGKSYAPNTRETVRRQTVHQFVQAGLVVPNPDDPDRPVNSPNVVYRVEGSLLGLLRSYGTPEWESNLRAYLASMGTLRERYAQERQMVRIPVLVAPNTIITLSPGGQNVLIKLIVDDFGSRFTPGGTVIYIGDTDEKFAHFDQETLQRLGVSVNPHGKMPDVVIHDAKRNQLVLIEAVTSHGPVDPKRREELTQLFHGSSASLVFVTAFLTRKAMVGYLNNISWETEVWVAEAPSHLIHFDGERFFGAY